MKTNITEEQKRFYDENGFLAIEGFLTADELEDWRAQVAEAVEQRLSADSAYLHNQGDSKSYYARVFTQCLKLAETHEGVHRLMHDPAIGELVCKLSGASGIRIWHDQALIKPPYGNPTAWHLDNPYWSFSAPNAISMWVALDDATLSNGCMWYLPGTHLAEGRENAPIAENLDSLFQMNPDWLEINPVAVPCPAGSAVFHNGLVAHGAGANMTNRPRRAMTCAYMPDGSTFNGQQNVLPGEYFASLTIGEALNDDSINPLVYPRSAS